MAVGRACQSGGASIWQLGVHVSRAGHLCGSWAWMSVGRGCQLADRAQVELTLADLPATTVAVAVCVNIYTEGRKLRELDSAYAR
jgi:hypothetical protein